jgi:hypothetical protein
MVLLVLFATMVGQSVFPTPGWSATEESSPYPGGESDDPNGDEGGDADEVLIRTNSTRPAPGAWGPPARIEAQESSGASASQEAATWWYQVLRWLGLAF